MGRIIQANSAEQNAFESIADFQTSMRRNAEVEFGYNGKIYNITQPLEGKTLICEAYKPETEAWYDNCYNAAKQAVEDGSSRPGSKSCGKS